MKLRRIGVIYPAPDPLTPAIWSGSPHGLASGLRTLGVDVVPIGAPLPMGIHQIVAAASRATGKRGGAAERTGVRVWSRTRAIRSQLGRQAGGLDGIIAMGLELFDLTRADLPNVPVATFDDATLLQMWREPESDIRISGFAARDVNRWVANQRRSLAAADICCVSTGYAKKSFVEDYRIDQQRVHIVGMGHRPRGSVSTDDRDWTRPNLLFVGVEWKRKNGDIVLKAFERFRRTRPDATLHLVGHHPTMTAPGVHDHGLLRRQDAEAQALLDRLYREATGFVLPSRYDLSPVSYLEAASAGLPVIGSSTGGAGEVLGDAGLAVHPDDIDGLADAMEAISDPVRGQEIGDRARARAAGFTWPEVAGRILGAMGLAVGGPGSPQRPIAHAR